MANHFELSWHDYDSMGIERVFGYQERVKWNGLRGFGGGVE